MSKSEKLDFLVVYLKSKRYLVVPKHWIKNPILSQCSTFFYSSDPNSIATFDLEQKYYVNGEVDACYEAFVIKSYESHEAAQVYASKKRLVAPVQYESFEKFDFDPPSEPMDVIEINDSGAEEAKLIFFPQNQEANAIRVVNDVMEASEPSDGQGNDSNNEAANVKS